MRVCMCADTCACVCMHVYRPLQLMQDIWSRTGNVSKTKRMTSGDGLSAGDIVPLQTDDGEIEMVNNIIYLPIWKFLVVL